VNLCEFVRVGGGGTDLFRLINTVPTTSFGLATSHSMEQTVSKGGLFQIPPFFCVTVEPDASFMDRSQSGNHTDPAQRRISFDRFSNQPFSKQSSDLFVPEIRNHPFDNLGRPVSSPMQWETPQFHNRGTSLIRNSAPLEPYNGTTLRALWGS